MDRLRYFRVGDHPALMMTALIVALGAGALYDVVRMVQPTDTVEVAPPITVFTVPTVTIPLPLPLPLPIPLPPPFVTQPATRPTSPPPTEPTVTMTTIPTVVVAAEAEQWITGATNQLRTSIGSPTLTVDAGLKAYAENWATHMAVTGTVEHSQISDLLGPWVIVGENIGQGGDVTLLFDQFVGSASHYEVMVNPAFTNTGVGIVQDAAGQLWVCHVFGGTALPTTTVPDVTLPTVTLPPTTLPTVPDVTVPSLPSVTIPTLPGPIN